MSKKAARGTKRVCQNCGSKFYDLDRNPIICPICSAVYQDQNAPIKPAIASSTEDDDDDEVISGSADGVEVVSLQEVEADENDLPDLEDNDMVIEEEASELSNNEETFIEVEDDDEGDDVTGIVSGSREEDDET